MREGETNHIREQCYIVLGKGDAKLTITIKINSFPVNATPWDIHFSYHFNQFLSCFFVNV